MLLATPPFSSSHLHIKMVAKTCAIMQQYVFEEQNKSLQQQPTRMMQVVWFLNSITCLYTAHAAVKLLNLLGQRFLNWLWLLSNDIITTIKRFLKQHNQKTLTYCQKIRFLHYVKFSEVADTQMEI